MGDWILFFIMIKINTGELYENYKSILDTCNSDARILPFVLTQFKIPNGFDYTQQEHRKKRDKMSKKKLELTKAQYIKRRAETMKMSKPKKLEEYYDKELRDWVKEYPQFKKILL